MHTNAKGFTLIELLIVIAIIAALSGIVVGFVNSARAKAENSRRVTDLKEVQKALELYYLDHNMRYPETPAYAGHPEAGNVYWWNDCYPTGAGSYWKTILGKELGPYMKQFPSDPKKGDCQSDKYYAYKSNGTAYKLRINNPTSPKNPPSKNLIDPAIDGGPNPCEIDGTGIYAWSIQSPEAACWR